MIPRPPGNNRQYDVSEAHTHVQEEFRDQWRWHFAGQIAAAIRGASVIASATTGHVPHPHLSGICADDALSQADALIKELEK